MAAIAAANLALLALASRGHAAARAGTCALAWLVGTPVVFIGAVLMGAPVDAARTLAWAAMQSALTYVPVAAAAGTAHPLAVAAWLASDRTDAPPVLRPAAGGPRASTGGISIVPAVAALAGSWFGSVTCLLDWDEPWQPWPISSVLGCGMATGAAWAGLALAWLCCRRSHSVAKAA
jgi:phosphatidylinositol glycan class F